MLCCVLDTYSLGGRHPPPPTPPPRRTPKAPPPPSKSAPPVVASPPPASQDTAPAAAAAAAASEESRSSLLFELDVNIHVDSGRCGLHPRLPPPPSLQQQQSSTTTTGAAAASPTSQSWVWPTSPAIGSPTSPQEDQFRAYLARYKRQLSQDPLLKPTDISVFYLPGLDVAVSPPTRGETLSLLCI